MIPVKVLSNEDVISILDIKSTIECTERAFVLKAAGEGRLFPLISEDLIPGEADMDIKSGILNGEDIFGLKLVSWFGTNEKKGLPALTGLTLIFDLKTGFPKAIINARHMTALRTGAAGAIGIKHFGRKDTKVLMVAGTGYQAAFQIAASLYAVPSIEKVYIYNPLRYESALNLQQCIKEKLYKIPADRNASKNIWIARIDSVEFEAITEPKTALQTTDAVITVTPSRAAYIKKEWVRPGAHFSCMGADMPGKQEIDEEIFRSARVFTDDISQASKAGELQSAVRQGIIESSSVNEIGSVISGSIKGRLTDEDITIFDSTGIALQDLSVSKYLLLKAEELNLGTTIEL